MRLHSDILRHNSHSVSFLECHLVFVTKYRHKVIDSEIADFIDRCFHWVASNIDVEIKEYKIDVDHCHLMVEYPPTLSIANMVKRFKGASSFYIRKQFPNLVSRDSHSASAFWSIGYFVTSVGEDAEERIRRYILNHREA